MDPLKRLVEIATREVGVQEVGGNNRGPRIVEYQSATWLKPAPWPWCAAYICWIIREWLKEAEVQSAFSLTSARAVEAWRPRTAGAFDFERWAKEKGLPVLTRKTKAKAGDLVIFDFSHIGIVIKDQRGSDTIETVEGNTNSGGQRDSTSGDGVCRKRRSASSVRSFIRLLS
jgi:hypothetical protein